MSDPKSAPQSSAPMAIPAAGGAGIVVPNNTPVAPAIGMIAPQNSFAAEDEQEAAASGGGDKDVAEAVQEKLAQLSVAKDGAGEGEEEEDGEEEEGEEEEEEEEIDYPPAVTALILLQQQHEELGDRFKKEFAALLKKYAALKKPLYESRATIVKDGISAAAAAAVVDGPKQAWASGEGEGEGAAAAAAARPAAGAATAEGGEVDKLPNFWLMCFQNHEMTCEMMLGERDEKALSYLIDVRAAYSEDMTGFKLEFEFSEDNEFFSNKVLTKSYEIPNLSDPFASTPTLQAVEGTEIEWESGMDLTVKLVTKKVKKKSSGGRRGGGGSTTRTVTREEPCKSFFNFFTAPDLEALEAGPDDDEDEEAFEEREELVSMDLHLANTIKDEIIPNAVLWYTGAAVDDDGDEDWIPGEDDDDEEDDEDGTGGGGGGGGKPKVVAGLFSKNGGGAGGAGGGAGGQEGQQECKQQ
eukprot:g1075.t1